MKSFRVAVLAAGKGTRMKQDVPKAMTPVAGKPILQHLVQSIIDSNVDEKPIIVIGPEGERFCDSFNIDCDYAVQDKQLGTGHAVMATKETVGDADALIVLYGDHPFISAESIKALAERHEERGNVLTLMTTTLPDFDHWRKAFSHWSRIVRGPEGHIARDVQYKDATEEELTIQEVNPCLLCFDTKWLWENIDKLKNENAQEEYYLTDLIGMAVEQNQQLSSIDVAAEEVLGINTQEEREIAESVLEKRYAKS